MSDGSGVSNVTLVSLGAAAGLVIGIVSASVAGGTLVSAAVPAVAPTYFLGTLWSAGHAAYPAVYACGVATYATYSATGVVLGGCAGGVSTFLFNDRPVHAPGPTDADRQRQERAQQAAEQAAAEVRAAQAEEADERAHAAVQVHEAAQRELEAAQENIRNAEEDQRQYPLPNYLRKAFESGNVNIAVTGQSGAGKSSCINAIRRMKKSDTGYARTGFVETTMEPVMYKFPSKIGVMRRTRVREYFHQNQDPDHSDGGATVGDRIVVDHHDQQRIAELIRVAGNELEVKFEDGETTIVLPRAVKGIFAEAYIWDLPGIGTPNHPKDTYLKNMGIRYFDMVLLITADRFTEADKTLKDELDHWNVPYFLVRNKVDAAVEAKITEEEEEDGSISDERKEEIQKETVAELKAYFEAEYGMEFVYAISTMVKFRDKYEFRQLESAMGAAMMNARGVTIERECPVCMETYADIPNGTAGTRQTMRPCGHVCCAQCLAEMLVREMPCPICRAQRTNSSHRSDVSVDSTALSV